MNKYNFVIENHILYRENSETFDNTKKVFFNYIEIIKKFQDSKINFISLEKSLKTLENSYSIYDDFFLENSQFLFSNNDKTCFVLKPHINISFESKDFDLKKRLFFIPKQISTNKQILIKTDIISDNIVFNKSSDILLVLKTEGKSGDFVQKHFSSPHYLKVNKTIINKIHIIIQNQDFKEINFQSGSIIIKLHFRKQK